VIKRAVKCGKKKSLRMDVTALCPFSKVDERRFHYLAGNDLIDSENGYEN
jgi:hypothetical protein